MEGIRGADDHESVKDKVVATYIPTASLGHPINELNTLHGGGVSPFLEQKMQRAPIK